MTKSSGDTPVGAVVDFKKGDKLTVTVKIDDKEMNLDGTYNLDGKKLTVKLTFGEEKISHDFTVKFKGDDELELVDGDKVDTLKKKK